jgi:[NiFe] hydrogenase assembly HybE family chaperone
MADVRIGARAEPGTPPQAARVAALVENFARIGRESMRGLPFYNEALSVEAVGFERFGDAWLGVLITPWFLNLMLVSDHAIPYSEAANGRKRMVELPGGPVTFLCGGTAEFGMFDAHSLASPMEAYKSQVQARAAARLALTRMRTPPEPAADRPAAQTVVSRRTLFSFAGRPLKSELSG